MKKAQAATKNNAKQRRDIKEKDRAAHKMRKEIIELKQQNQTLNQMVKDLQASQVIVRQTVQPRVQSASVNNQQSQLRTQQQQDELRRVSFDNQRLQEKCTQFTRQLEELQTLIAQKDGEMAILNSDKVRFKELSEGYMQQVARLEAQFEAADLKPPVKAQKRPKDTVTRDGKISISNVNGQRQRNIDAKQLNEVIQLIKLLL